MRFFAARSLVRHERPLLQGAQASRQRTRPNLPLFRAPAPLAPIFSFQPTNGRRIGILDLEPVRRAARPMYEDNAGRGRVVEKIFSSPNPSFRTRPDDPWPALTASPMSYKSFGTSRPPTIQASSPSDLVDRLSSNDLIERVAMWAVEMNLWTRHDTSLPALGGAPAQLSRSGPGLRLRQMDNGQSSGWQCPQLSEPL